MKYLRAIKPAKLAVLILVGVALLMGFNGCAAPAAIKVSYDSIEGDPYAIRARASILVRINEDNLDRAFRNPETKQSIVNAVKTDLQQNMFYGGEEELDILVKIDELTVETKLYPRAIVRLGLFLSGIFLAGPYMNLTIEEMNDKESILVLTGTLMMCSPLLPSKIFIGKSNLSLEIREKGGSFIGKYVSVKEVTSKSILDRYAYLRARLGGVSTSALKLALEDIKSQIIADKDRINRAIQGIKTVPEPEVLPPVARSRPKVQAGATNIAVMDLDAFAISAPEALALTNRLRVELFNTGRFVVLERGKMQDILKEQGFQETGCTTTDCLVEVGQLLNMQHMVAGSVSKVGDVYSIEVRLIDVGTGEIIAATVEDITGSLGDLLTKGIRNASLKLVQ